MSLYLLIYCHCLSLDTHPTRDLKLNLSSPALTDCTTQLDCLMPKVSSSREHKTPTVYCSVKHWQKDTPTHTDSNVWFHLQSWTLIVSLLWLITEGLETWEALFRYAGHVEKWLDSFNTDFCFPFFHFSSCKSYWSYPNKGGWFVYLLPPLL